jgi:hypothetical protein
VPSAGATRSTALAASSGTAYPPAWQPPGAPLELPSAGEMAEAAVEFQRESEELGDWRRSLDDAIRALEGKLQEPYGDPALRRQEQALLHLLYLADQRHRDATQPIEQWPTAEQAFWMHLLDAMNTYLDARGTPVAENRAQLTLQNLERAAGYLASTSQLDVRNLAFCESVESFGRYSEFEACEFAPEQEVLLYVEIENFQADETPEGWVTALAGSYQILDERGRRVGQYTFPVEKEVCRNRRHDFFIPYRMWMPGRILPGRYTLQLTIEDTRGNKFGQSSIEFSIVE